MKLVCSIILGLVSILGGIVLFAFCQWAGAWDEGGSLPLVLPLLGVTVIGGGLFAAFRFFAAWRKERRDPR